MIFLLSVSNLLLLVSIKFKNNWRKHWPTSAKSRTQNLTFQEIRKCQKKVFWGVFQGNSRYTYNLSTSDHQTKKKGNKNNFAGGDNSMSKYNSTPYYKHSYSYFPIMTCLSGFLNIFFFSSIFWGILI